MTSRVPALPLALLLAAAPATAAPRIQPELPPENARYSQGSAVVSDTTPDAWWESFGDPALDALVTEAVEQNLDIAQAQDRVRQARAVTVQNLAPLLPTASFDVGINASPTSLQAFQIPPNLADIFGGGSGGSTGDDDDSPDLIWNGNALFNFGWNIDLGASALRLRAATLDTAAALGDRDGAARQIVAQVASSWMDVRTARARVAVIQQQVSTNQDLLEITRRRFESGQAAGLDVLQQQQQLANAQALLPQAEQLLRLQEQRLAVLLARDPTQITGALDPIDSLPPLPPQPGLSTPRELLENRPDLVALQARFLAARSRKDATILGFLPTFRLSANVGWTYRWFDEWSSAETYGLGASMSVPLFGGGQRWGAVQQAKASQDAAAHALSAGVLAATSEVEGALAVEETAAERLERLDSQLKAARLAYEESARQYAQGLVTYLVVLTNLGSLQALELNHLQAQRELLGARIDLHTALGASWADRLSEGESR